MRAACRYDQDPNALLLQHFVSEFGVFEVYWHERLLRCVCTCPGFRFRYTCRHVEYVDAAAEEEGFVLNCNSEPTMEDQHRFAHEPGFARQWALRHTVVQVI